MRTKNSENVKNKYNLKIFVCDECKLDANYPSLKKIAETLQIPYGTLTDIYECRRTSITRYENCYYFPKFTISSIQV